MKMWIRTCGLAVAAAFGAVLSMAGAATAAAVDMPTFVVADLVTTPGEAYYDVSDPIEGGELNFFGLNWALDNSGSGEAYEITIDGIRFWDTVSSDLSLFVSTSKVDYASGSGITPSGTVLPAAILFSGQSFAAGTPGADAPLSLTFQVPAFTTYYLSLAGSSLKGGGILLELNAAEASPVPLPAALPLLAAGLGGLALVARRRRG